MTSLESQLESVVSYAKIKLDEAYADASNELRRVWRSAKFGAVVGFGYGVASRVSGYGMGLLLPAALTSFVFMGRKPRWSDYLDFAGTSTAGYLAGFVLTDVVLRALFPEQIAPQPIIPPQNTPQQLPLPTPPLGPQRPSIFV